MKIITGLETACGGEKVKTIQADLQSWVGEFRNKEFENKLGQRRMILKEKVLYYSETNAVAEGANRTILRMEGSILPHLDTRIDSWTPQVHGQRMSRTVATQNLATENQHAVHCPPK